MNFTFSYVYAMHRLFIGLSFTNIRRLNSVQMQAGVLRHEYSAELCAKLNKRWPVIQDIMNL